MSGQRELLFILKKVMNFKMMMVNFVKQKRKKNPKMKSKMKMTKIKIQMNTMKIDYILKMHIKTRKDINNLIVNMV